jgi:hypothetical protein
MTMWSLPGGVPLPTQEARCRRRRRLVVVPFSGKTDGTEIVRDGIVPLMYYCGMPQNYAATRLQACPTGGRGWSMRAPTTALRFVQLGPRKGWGDGSMRVDGKPRAAPVGVLVLNSGQ